MKFIRDVRDLPPWDDDEMSRPKPPGWWARHPYCVQVTVYAVGVPVGQWGWHIITGWMAVITALMLLLVGLPFAYWRDRRRARKATYFQRVREPVQWPR